MDVRPLRVHDIRWEAEGVLSIGLTDPAGGELPAWSAGAHVDVRLSATIERQFSLCSDPADRRTWRIAVLREEVSRGGSRHVHEVLRPGDLVDVRSPVNNFALRRAPRYVFVAGGIGITPILPMIRSVRDLGLPWRLAYLGRRAAGMAFAADPLLDSPAVQLFAADRGERIDLASWIGGPADGTAVYCCGPARLLDAAEALAAGWAPGTLRTERFQPVPRPAGQPEGSFTVNCARSGCSVAVGPGRSILASLEDAGLDVPSSCREGVCGTCETRLLEGIPEHRDSILAPDEREAGDVMMICVSRARTPQLVLDI
jgi:tetrachlorobenzoquinone reductase